MPEQWSRNGRLAENLIKQIKCEVVQDRVRRMDSRRILKTIQPLPSSRGTATARHSDLSLWLRRSLGSRVESVLIYNEATARIDSS